MKLTNVLTILLMGILTTSILSAQESEWSQVERLLKKSGRGFGVGADIGLAGYGFSKSFELVPFKKSDDFHFFCSGGVKFGLSVLSIGASFNVSRKLRCDYAENYSGYFLNVNAGGGEGINVGGSFSYGMKDSFPKRLKMALIPNFVGSEKWEQNPDRVEILELLEEIDEFSQCLNLPKPGQVVPGQTKYLKYFKNLSSSFGQMAKHFNAKDTKKLAKQVKDAIVNRANFCNDAGLSPLAISKFLQKSLKRKIRTVLDENNPAYLLPDVDDFKRFLKMWEDNKFPNLEKIYKIFVEEMTGCDGVAISGGVGAGLLPVNASVSLTYYNEIKPSLSKEVGEAFIKKMKTLVEKGVIESFATGKVKFQDVEKMLTKLALDPDIEEKYNRCMIGDYQQVFSDLIATADEAKRAVKIGHEELSKAYLKFKGIVHHPYAGEAANPAILLFTMEKVFVRIKSIQDSLTVFYGADGLTEEDQAKLEMMEKSYKHARFQIVALYNSIYNLYNQAIDRYSAAKKATTGKINAFLATEDHWEELRVSEGQKKFLQIKLEKAKEIKDQARLIHKMFEKRIQP